MARRVVRSTSGSRGRTKATARGRKGRRTAAATRSSRTIAKIKTTDRTIYSNAGWTVRHGELKRSRGRPRKVRPLFKVVAEKVPFEALDSVRKDMKARSIAATGIYIAHDSMGVARYVGRGQIFARLKARKRAQALELTYFSIYVGMEKTHERELETVIIRSVGPQAYFNTRKKREDIQPGNVRDYEAGTQFYERQYTRGPKRKKTEATRSRSARRSGGGGEAAARRRRR